MLQPISSDIRDGLWHWVYHITHSLTVSHSHTLFSCHLHRTKLWMFVASYLLVRLVHSFDPWFGSGWTKWGWYLVDIKDLPCYFIIHIYIYIHYIIIIKIYIYMRLFFWIFNFNHAGREFVYGSSSHWDLRHCYQDAKLQPVAEGDQAAAWIGEFCRGFDSFPLVNCPITMENHHF